MTRTYGETAPKDRGQSDGETAGDEHNSRQKESRPTPTHARVRAFSLSPFIISQPPIHPFVAVNTASMDLGR